MSLLSKIDDDLINILRQYNDGYWIKKMVYHGKFEVEPEANIGDKRWCDLLVTILGYQENKVQKVAIEVENDREFDASEILRKIKKDQPYPTIVIIPYKKEKDAWRFQESMIRVWFWKAKIKWKCQSCQSVFQTTSSITPIKCEKCSKGSNFLTYEGVDPEDVEFIEAQGNTTLTFSEIQERLKPRAKIEFVGTTKPIR